MAERKYTVGIRALDWRSNVVHVTLFASDAIDAEWKAIMHCQNNLGIKVEGKLSDIVESAREIE